MVESNNEGESTKPKVHRIEDTKIEKYSAYLRDQNRPPSRGGNTKAWHSHAIQVDGVWYTFLALGSKKFVFATDTVSFSWKFDDSGQFRNIIRSTIVTKDKSGQRVHRGQVQFNKPWRYSERDH